MKIGIVCFNLSWQAGGPRLIFSTARALRQLGHTVTIYAPEFSGKYFRELWEGTDIRVVPPPEPLAWTDQGGNILRRILNKIRNERNMIRAARKIADAMDQDTEVVNVHDFAYPVGYFYKKRRPSARVIWTENDPPFSYLPKAGLLQDLAARVFKVWKEGSARKYLRAVDRVSVLDFYNRDWCLARGLRPEVVRLGVDAEQFHQPVREFRPGPGRPVRLFGFGSLNPHRRYEDIIRAVRILGDRGVDARATIVSNNQWGVNDYRNFLTELTAKEGVADRVTLRFEGVPDAELRELFRDHDFFVYPMYIPAPRNGFGFSIGVLEAIAAGLPTVVCRTTTSTEVLKDGETVLLVDPKSPDQIADRVAEVTAHPEMHRRIAEAGQELVRRELTWENYANGLIRLITSHD